MAWNTLVTKGKRPGTRDSHSAVLVGHQMIVFGGTNGSKKVNDLHVLDLRTKEWSSPNCEGIPPSPRESHTATVVGDDKLVIFGGSGEGEGNYLNDLHVLDLKTMRWIATKVKGELPAPRDSHTAVAINNKLLVYGGDCGDRYHGQVDILDMDTLTWSKLVVQGSSPGVRAGHASVIIGSKVVYVIGGVGDKHYYNDVWILDVNTCSWTQLDIRGQQPQGRFSHTAVITDSDIAIYGGCGEDERPLNELLILQLGAEHPNGRYNISLCKIFGSHWNHEKRRFPRGAEINQVDLKPFFVDYFIGLIISKYIKFTAFAIYYSDNLHSKKRRTGDSKAWEVESEQEEHSLSLSQNSSPSQSDQEQTPIKAAPHPLCLLKQGFQTPNDRNSNNVLNNQSDQISSIRRTPQDFHFMGGENPRQPPKQEQFLHINMGRQEGQFPVAEQKPMEAMAISSLIGADVRGKVDGAFDSGFLMTANVNGKIFRGVLFSPGTGFVSRAAVLPPKSSSLTSTIPIPYSNSNHVPTYVRQSQQPMAFTIPDSSHHLGRTQSSSVVLRATPSLARSSGIRSDLKDVVLTLGGPGSVDGGS
ncbi:Kelch repeat type 1 [Macleaya cordata]|uniref:Kelch repeat type 1 n=1 Tax=Macleaya cordata TaxID=56857 RepID=A0A200R239_MACCD|nr:Kelch repeat type 1 [Macleaya cordata]